MPYRGRAVKRIKGQRKMKAGAPTAKFTMTKNFQLKANSAPSNVYALAVDASTPFQPIFDVMDNNNNPLGDWVDNDASLNEPIGLSSDLYTNYNTLVVKGCHVSVSVTQGTDITKTAAETLGTGQVTLARTADLISAIPTTASLKEWFGQKTKNFQLSTGQGELTKNAYVSNGYSAKKQFNVNANANEDLKVVNASGSSNKATDQTYIYCFIKPRADTPSEDTYLLPMYVTMRISYIIQFQDPDKYQSVPLPMSTRKTRAKRKVANRKLHNAATAYGMSNLMAMLGGAGFGVPLIAAANRYRNRRERRVGFRPQWVQ